MTIEEATKVAQDILPEKVLALHVKEETARETVYAVLMTAIFGSANFPTHDA